MRIGLVAALLVGTGGIAAVITAPGCKDLPACASEAEFREAVARGERADLFACRYAGSDAGNDVDEPPPPECVPSATNASPADDGTCGVFVSSLGDDANAGNRMGTPVATLAKALELAATSQKRVVYMCAQAFETSAEAADVTVPEGFTIYGGLNCDGAVWTFSDGTAKTRLSASADRVPLRLGGGGRVTEFHDLHIVAKSATVVSGSSIAVIAEDATATFYRSLLETGDGADGAPGEEYTETAGAGQNGVAPTAQACSAAVVPNEDVPSNVCSSGGTGGPGGTTQGFAGGSGLPEGTDNGGAGEMGATTCQSGTDGGNGADGEPGAAVTELGTLDAKVGYKGVVGADGKSGAPGRGGGGGGGARSIVSSANKCPGSMGGGAAGGTGASGGCGGQGGHGGGPGGASIAVVSLRSKLTFDACEMKLGKGGQPGSGGIGQKGGPGGAMGGAGGTAPSGLGLKNGCEGGRGGNGGKGGSGADGPGGHVIGVAFTAPSDGTEPVFQNMSDADVTSGEPGLNGGVKGKTQKF